jgi:hypothetical protein
VDADLKPAVEKVAESMIHLYDQISAFGEYPDLFRCICPGQPAKNMGAAGAIRGACAGERVRPAFRQEELGIRKRENRPRAS